MQGEWTGNALVVTILASIVFLRCASALNHTVGGPSGWDLRSNLQLWSASTVFHVGDTLVFSYTPNHDVIEVNQIGYDNCVISTPLATYDDGETVIQLTQQGTRHFVCGRLGHCQQGLKLEVQVLASSNNGTDVGGPTLSPSDLPPAPPSPPAPFSPSSRPIPAPPARVHKSGVDNIKVNTPDGLFQGLLPIIALVVIYSLTLPLV